MLVKRVLCIFIFTFSTFLLTAQNCKDLVEWMDLIKQEYPETTSLRYMNRGKMQKLAANYFSKNYFESYRGKPYAQLSQKTLAKDFRKIQLCFVKGNYRNDPHYNWVFQNIIYNNYLAYSNPNFINQIATVDTKRSKLKKELVNISGNTTSRDELLQLKQRLSVEYAVLLDSELRQAITEIDAIIAKKSDAQLDELLTYIEKLNRDKESLVKISKLNQKATQLLPEASQAKQTEFQSRLDAKTVALLQNAIDIDLGPLNQNLDIAQINQKLKAFKQDYGSFSRHSQVKKGEQKLIAQKEKLVNTQIKTIEAQIVQADNTSFPRLENKYMSYLPQQSSQYQKLNALFASRKKQLVEQQRLAQQQKKLEGSNERIAFLEANGKDEGSMQFKTVGLNNAAFFDYIYRGHFENIELDVFSSHFLMILSGYLNTFGSLCPDELPENKVEIMTDVCSRESVTTDGYGVEVSRYCTAWKTIGTGIFADPKLYAAKMRLVAQQNQDAFRIAVDMYTNPDAMGNSIDQVHKAKALLSDWSNFFRFNACDSKSVKQFETNLLAFANQQKPERLKGMSVYEKIKILGGPAGDQNHAKLLNDIVSNQSKTWALNKYTGNSISNVRELKSADQTQMVTLKADYNFSGLLGKQTGGVTVKFKDGLPDCIYFSDYPNNCKKPNSALVAKYGLGEYAK
ncbi:coiled-coil domain-containing protein [Maribacter cobaltidurans]|uniref:Uncharacterized protein n=1 Tax=Maribacter cobaltidurans TaxID=1178778 RepID=A0A223V3Q1_9FLAO|nr:hypothetical protein [Maribacter cobaltidurans]ASV29618.1 hypothetical protein CJ263_04970 [Maribacter cobaltidurans]GGD67435.1 hypothetical protein GCM10011412_01230 [Maribacter cobaltidurans]